MTNYDKCMKYLQEEKGLNLSQSLLVIEGLKSAVDVDILTSQDYDYGQMREILHGLQKGVDVTLYSDNRFTANQMEYLCQCLENKLNIAEFASPEYSLAQMKAIMMCCGLKLDAAPFKRDELMAVYANAILKYYPAIDLNGDFSWLSSCEDEEKVSYILEAKVNGSFRNDMLLKSTRELRTERESEKKNAFYDDLLNPDRLKRFELFNSYE